MPTQYYPDFVSRIINYRLDYAEIDMAEDIVAVIEMLADNDGETIETAWVDDEMSFGKSRMTRSVGIQRVFDDDLRVFVQPLNAFAVSTLIRSLLYMQLHDMAFCGPDIYPSIREQQLAHGLVENYIDSYSAIMGALSDTKLTDTDALDIADGYTKRMGQDAISLYTYCTNHGDLTGSRFFVLANYVSTAIFTWKQQTKWLTLPDWEEPFTLPQFYQIMKKLIGVMDASSDLSIVIDRYGGGESLAARMERNRSYFLSTWVDILTNYIRVSEGDVPDHVMDEMEDVLFDDE